MVGRLRGAGVPRRLRAVPSHKGRLRECALTRILIALGLFVVLAIWVASGITHGVDEATLSFIQTLHARWLDLAASIVTLAGDPSVTAGLAAGLVVARLLKRRPAALVPLAIAVVVLAEVILKAVVPHSPPPGELSRSIPILPTIEAPVPYSFPSGHLARLSFLLAITSVPTWLSVVAIALMGLTRIYLAEHWLTDVIGGLLLGLAVAWSVRVLTQQNRP